MIFPLEVIVQILAFGALAQGHGHGQRQPKAIESFAGCGLLPDFMPDNSLPIDIRGSPLVAERVPWLVAIYERWQGRLQYDCGGVLIHPNFALTAAACFKFSTDPEKFTLALAPFHGDVLKNAEDRTTRIVGVKNITVHPNYQPENGYESNLAVVKLAHPVGSDGYVVPVCVSNGDPVPGESGQIAGFVRNWYRGGMSKLISGCLTVLDTRDCINIIQDVPSAGQFCAGTNESIINFRDLGSGGLVFQQGERYFVKGILSHGSPVRKDLPLVFTSVPWFSDWIAAQMQNMGLY